MGRKRLELAGQRFGSWTVISFEEKRKGSLYWRCQCDCGTENIVFGASLTSGRSKSCGCLRREETSSGNKKHGMCKTPTYSSWMSMKTRCDNPKKKGYKYWGGRGISYDPRWAEFTEFLKDMGDRPEGTSLDRIDPDGNYCKENCAWRSYQKQVDNRRGWLLIKRSKLKSMLKGFHHKIRKQEQRIIELESENERLKNGL